MSLFSTKLFETYDDHKSSDINLKTSAMNNRNFRYTKNNKGLNDEQREFYEKNGYILIENNVPHELIDELVEHFRDLAEGRKYTVSPTEILKDPTLKKRGLKGEKVVNKIQDFLYDEVLFQYAKLPAITDVVESVIGPNIIGVHSMLINKPPSSTEENSRHPLHQDLNYFPFRPIDSIVASWTAMEHVDKTNGGLYVLPGSHLEGIFYDHTYPSKESRRFYYEVSGFDNGKFVDFVMEKGDTVFFHPLLLHGSYHNKSQGYRKAISVHFADSFCKFIDVKGTPHEKICEEFKSTFGFEYNIFFKLKSRHIKGKPGTYRNITSKI